MKAYKLFYNDELYRFDLYEFEVKGEYDFSHDPKTNLYGEDHIHSCDKESACEGLQKLNKQLEDGELEVAQCKDCEIYFIIPAKEKQWFADRDLQTPKRCPKCRARRKASNPRYGELADNKYRRPFY